MPAPGRGTCGCPCSAAPPGPGRWSGGPGEAWRWPWWSSRSRRSWGCWCVAAPGARRSSRRRWCSSPRWVSRTCGWPRSAPGRSPRWPTNARWSGSAPRSSATPARSTGASATRWPCGCGCSTSRAAARGTCSPPRSSCSARPPGALSSWGRRWRPPGGWCGPTTPTSQACSSRPPTPGWSRVRVLRGAGRGGSARRSAPPWRTVRRCSVRWCRPWSTGTTPACPRRWPSSSG